MTMQLRLLDYNYPFQSGVGISASSSDSNFPVSNLSDYMRAKSWRSSGNFTIDSTNNKIDFQKVNAGSVLTGTIAAGSYSPTTLAAAIKAALEAADGVNTYTISYSSLTGLWTISTNGSFLSLLINSGSNTATSIGPVIGFTNYQDYTGATSYTGPQIAIHTEEWVLIDLKNPQNIDSFVMAFDPTSGIPFSENAVITLQAHPTTDWANAEVNQTLTISDTYDSLSYFFTTNKYYRYWRIKIVDPSNPNLYVQISKVGLALATQLSRLPSQGFTFDLTDQTAVDRNAYGSEYSDIYPEKKALNLSYAGMSYSDIQLLDSIYRRLGIIVPMFICLDPTQDSYSKDHFLLYGKFATSHLPAHNSGSFFDEQVSFTEVF
jgi:hypothetical protein